MFLLKKIEKMEFILGKYCAGYNKICRNNFMTYFIKHELQD